MMIKDISKSQEASSPVIITAYDNNTKSRILDNRSQTPPTIAHASALEETKPGNISMKDSEAMLNEE
jgi:hypothetical protein